MFKQDVEFYGKSEDSKAKFHFVADVKEIIEYTPADPEANSYNKDTDTVVGEAVKVANCLDLEVEDLSEDSKRITFVAQDKDKLHTVFRAICTFNTAGMTAPTGITMGADDVKCDYEINVEVTEEGNKIALLGKVESSSKSKTKIQKEDDSTKVNGIETEESDGVSARFDWVSEIECGDKKDLRKVHVSNLKDSSASVSGDSAVEVAWTMHKQKGDQVCLWDPVIGVDTGVSGAAAGPATTVAVSLGLALAALFAQY